MWRSGGAIGNLVVKTDPELRFKKQLERRGSLAQKGSGQAIQEAEEQVRLNSEVPAPHMFMNWWSVLPMFRQPTEELRTLRVT